jgi:hypothetical protein
MSNLPLTGTPPRKRTFVQSGRRSSLLGSGLVKRNAADSKAMAAVRVQGCRADPDNVIATSGARRYPPDAESAGYARS